MNTSENLIRVKTWEDDVKQRKLFEVKVQPYEVWRPPTRPPLDAGEIDIFLAEDPCIIDLVEMCNAELKHIDELFLWKVG